MCEQLKVAIASLQTRLTYFLSTSKKFFAHFHFINLASILLCLCAGIAHHLRPRLVLNLSSGNTWNSINDIHFPMFYRILPLENCSGTLPRCLLCVTFLCEFMSGFGTLPNMLCEGRDFDSSIMLCIKPMASEHELKYFISLSH